ncbi:MAG: ferrous iron transport protein A [Planctomycetes bacterium]|nr:ferrous iron transport protein A [Planctomycetota bacterium]
MTPPREPISLADLPRVGLARVVSVKGGDATSQRLRELGFTPGTEVDFVRRAPLAGPLVVQLRGYQLALRPAEACRVLIETPTGGQP